MEISNNTLYRKHFSCILNDVLKIKYIYFLNIGHYLMTNAIYWLFSMGSKISGISEIVK